MMPYPLFPGEAALLSSAEPLPDDEFMTAAARKDVQLTVGRAPKAAGGESRLDRERAGEMDSGSRSGYGRGVVEFGERQPGASVGLCPRLKGHESVLKPGPQSPDLCPTCGRPLLVGGESVFCSQSCEEADWSEEQDRLEDRACQRDRERVGMPSRED